MAEKSLPTQRNAARAAVRELIDRLLSESFAREHGLADRDLKEVAKLFEGESLSEEGSEAPHDESFERCRSTYCLLLMELETQGLTEDAITPLKAWSSGAENPAADPKPHGVPPLPQAKAPPLPKPARRADPPPAKVPEGDEPVVELSGPPKEYLRIAQYFQSWLGVSSAPFGSDYVERLIGQNLCFSLESQCHRTLRHALERFWGQRQTAIESLMTRSDEDVLDFEPAVLEALNKLAEQHRFWLGENRFPHSAVRHAMRYLFARPQADDFAPSLIEAGTLILFFGNPGAIGGKQLGNELGAEGLGADDTIELAFRLIHLQRARNTLLIPTTPLPESSQRKALYQEIRRTLHLIASLTLGNRTRNAAA
jgi:hypothetical protein